jgi:peptidoglycan hydrolase-like protein with peptidoglycan-binding domain
VAPAPRIVTRREWGAAFTIPGGRHVAPSARRWFVVHWPGSAVAGDERAVVRAIERSHRTGQGWAAAPGYNYLVGRSGTIYEGCGRDVRGIHSPPRNTDGWGVCVMIAVGETPPQAALNATRQLYNWLNSVAGRTLGMSWHGQHHPTACAGPALNSWVQRGMPAGAAPAPPPPGPGGAPAFPGRILRQPPIMRGEDVRTWQTRVRARGWSNVAVDGAYGPISEGACRQVQQIGRLPVDGRVGPNTWPVTWRDSAGPGGSPAPPPPPPPGQPTGLAESPIAMVAQVNLAWDTVTGPAARFTVQVQRGNTGTANIRTFEVPVPSTGRTSFAVPDLAPRELHRWRVSRGTWSAWREFRTP